MKPAPYHLELPGTPVTDWPTQPPVQDSADVKKKFLSISSSPNSALSNSSLSKFKVLPQIEKTSIKTEMKCLSRY